MAGRPEAPILDGDLREPKTFYHNGAYKTSRVAINLEKMKVGPSRGPAGIGGRRWTLRPRPGARRRRRGAWEAGLRRAEGARACSLLWRPLHPSQGSAWQAAPGVRQHRAHEADPLLHGHNTAAPASQGSPQASGPCPRHDPPSHRS